MISLQKRVLWISKIDYEIMSLTNLVLINMKHY